MALEGGVGGVAGSIDLLESRFACCRFLECLIKVHDEITLLLSSDLLAVVGAFYILFQAKDLQLILYRCAIYSFVLLYHHKVSASFLPQC